MCISYRTRRVPFILRYPQNEKVRRTNRLSDTIRSDFSCIGIVSNYIVVRYPSEVLTLVFFRHVLTRVLTRAYGGRVFVVRCRRRVLQRGEVQSEEQGELDGGHEGPHGLLEQWARRRCQCSGYLSTFMTTLATSHITLLRGNTVFNTIYGLETWRVSRCS